MLWVALALGAAVVVAVVVAAVVHERQKRALARRQETVEQKYQETSGAFGGAGAVANDADTQAIDFVLTRIETAMRQQDAGTLFTHLDLDLMFEDLERRGLIPKAGRSERSRFRGGFKAGFMRGLQNASANFDWQRHQIKRVRVRGGNGGKGSGAEAVVYLRMHHSKTASAKMRWWLRKTDTGWKAYDYEDLDTGLRTSTTIGLLVSNPAQAASVGSFGEGIAGGAKALLEGDGKAAEAALAAIPSSGLPPPLDAVRCLLMGNAVRLQGRYDEAFAFFAQAEALNPDVPAVHQARAAAYNALGRHEEALASLEKYERVLGPDETLYEHRGAALLGLKRPAEAAEAYRKGLDDTPDSWANLAGLAAALPAGDKVELAQRFAKVTRHQDVFRAVAGDVISKDDADALAALVPAYRRTPAGAVDPYADYYEGGEMLLRGQYEEAARIIADVRPKMPARDQPLMDSELRRALLELGRYTDAYRAASSPQDAFDVIANHARHKQNLAALRELIALHAKDYQGKDASIHFYEGCAFDLENRFDKAAEAFLKGMRLAPEEYRHNYRREGVYSAFAAGQVVEAYERFGEWDRKGTLAQLAVECSRARRPDLLEALLERHRREAPSDPGLPRWEAELHFIKGEYSQAVELLTRHRDGLLKEYSAGGYWDRLVRSLVRTRRFQEAVLEAETQAGREEGVTSLVALAYAAAGNAGRATAALDRHVARDGKGAAVEALYNDVDLGPLLRSDLLRAWRERNPPPPSTQPGGGEGGDGG